MCRFTHQSLGAHAILALSVGIFVACQPPDPAAELQPITDSYVQAWNTGDVSLLDSIVDPAFARHADRYGATGLDSLKQVIAAIRTQYPDFTVTIDEQFFTADHGMARWTWTGTNTGPGDFPPTGVAVTQTGASLVRFSNGKVAEEWAYTDNLALLTQLGFTVTPPETP